MICYAVLLPLSGLILRLLHSSRVRLLPPSRKIIESTCNEIQDLWNCIIEDLEELEVGSSYYEMPKALDLQIREAVYRLEDSLESHLASQYLTQSEESLASDPNCLPKFIIDLEEVKQEINSFIATVMKIKEEYVDIVKLGTMCTPSASYMKESKEINDEDDEAIMYSEEDWLKSEEDWLEYSEEDWPPASSNQMVGLVDQFRELRPLLIKGRPRAADRHNIFFITGMAGIGKTALAKQLYNDPLISNHFNCRAFVSVGQKYQYKQVILDILSQVECHFDIANRQSESTPKLVKCLVRSLAGKRSLLVFDDVWSEKIFSDFRWLFLLVRPTRSKIRVLITTRIASITENPEPFREKIPELIGENFPMRFLSDKESWSLLCEKVFGKDSWCPFELEKVGRKIVEDCEGLPLAIIAVANLLVKDKYNLDYWTKVSQDPNPLCIGTNEQQPMLDVLYSSYNYLSPLLKPFFLYMGVFPRRREIVASKLFLLWSGEGFGAPDYESSRCPCRRTVADIADQSLLLVIKAATGVGIKTFKLHSVYWHICVSEARKENLFQVVDKYAGHSFKEVIKGHRRLCIHNNTLFGIKDAHNSMSSNSDVRSLLCTGMHHCYPIPMCFEMRLLRVLDALTIRFYVFPLEVVKLVLLRYLAFTYTGMLHASIHQLWNLQVLIVQPNLSIITPDAPLYLPVEIWNMKELKHLQVVGAILPDPSPGAILRKLETILDINAQSFTAAVVDSIPNLIKLGIQIDSSTHDPFSSLLHLSRLCHLASLKCVVIHPKPKSQFVTPPSPSKIFPSRLKKLSLSGFGYPWEYMREIGQLKDLKVLKLCNYAFRGREWDMDGCKFAELKVLHLEDLDLVHWGSSNSHALLGRLIIKHCYKLQNIPDELDFMVFQVIKLVEVKPSLVASAKKRFGGVQWMRIQVDCSWLDGN